MSETLPPVLARELDRWARELGPGGGGLLMVAVGVSARRRHALESQLRAALDDWEVVRVSVEHACADPWGQVSATVPSPGPRTLVSLTGMSECEDPDRTLAALNLGREHLRRGSMSLVLWAGGLEQLDRIRRKAPDLWSYRRRVGFFLAAEDFDLPSPKIDDSQTFTAKIEQARARLDALAPDDPHRVELLLQLFDHLDSLGDKSSAAAALDQAAALLDESSAEAEHAGLLGARSWSAFSFERIGEMLSWTERIDWSSRESSAAHTAASHAAIAYLERRNFADAARACEAVRQLGELFTTTSASGFATNEAQMWLLLGDLPRARQQCAKATHEGERWAYDASFFAEHRAWIARERLESHAQLVALHESWALRDRMEADRLSADVAARVITAYRTLGLFDDAERLCAVALGQDIPGFEATVDLTIELVQTQACRDLSAARETQAAILEQLELRLETCPAWERAMLRRTRAQLLRLELHFFEPELADELRRACLDELDLAIYDAIDQRQVDLAQWARRQQAELARELSCFPRALALASTALEWSTTHEGPSRVSECHLELAKTHRAAGQLEAAAAQLGAAERVLSADVPRYQPRETWKLLLIERHHLALAREDPPAALADLDHALTRMRAAGLRRLELELLHLVAELPEHPSTDARREQAAREALELARDAYLVFEEARALANLAILEHERAPQRARRQLEEARSLASTCVFEPAHARMYAAELALEVG